MILIMVKFVLSVMANSLLTLLNQTPKTKANLSGLPPWLTCYLEVSHTPNGAVTQQRGHTRREHFLQKNRFAR